MIECGFQHLAERERATRLGDIARLLVARGEPEEALQIYRETLAILEASGDKRGLVMTLGDIARLLIAKGEVDGALKLHEKRRAILQFLGQNLARAIHLRDIARLLAARTEVDRALKLHQEELAVYEAERHPRGIADTLWSIARIKLHQQHSRRALEHQAASYSFCLKLGNVLPICHVGIDFGEFLCTLGQREQGLVVLERSRNGFAELGRAGDARYVETIIKKYTEPLQEKVKPRD